MGASTLAKAERELAEFVKPMSVPFGAPNMPLDGRMLMLSTHQAHGIPPWKLLAHPLLKLVRVYYWDSPAEREVILPFFEDQ